MEKANVDPSRKPPPLAALREHWRPHGPMEQSTRIIPQRSRGRGGGRRGAGGRKGYRPPGYPIQESPGAARNWKQALHQPGLPLAPRLHHPSTGSASMSRTHLARSAGLVMALIMISRLLGFVRERAIAEVFGRTWETDAFRAAFN